MKEIMRIEDVPGELRDKIRVLEGHWIWLGSTNGKGYARVSYQKTHWSVHRLLWLLSGKDIPDGYEIDHLCRIPICVNPGHFECVTHAVNSGRQVSWLGKKTHCHKGHPYDEKNTLVSGGRRRCRECMKQWTWRVNRRQAKEDAQRRHQLLESVRQKLADDAA